MVKYSHLEKKEPGFACITIYDLSKSSPVIQDVLRKDKKPGLAWKMTKGSKSKILNVWLSRYPPINFENTERIEPLKKVQNNKIDKCSRLGLMTLFMDSSGKCMLPHWIKQNSKILKHYYLEHNMGYIMFQLLWNNLDF